jgi:glycosyltransferase involved in cell wall biosynthesis
MLVPLLARGNRQRIESQVLTLSTGDARFAVVRQSGLPVHEIACSRKRFAPGSIFEARRLVAQFKPDLLHAWGSTAQVMATRWLAKRDKHVIPVVWSISRTQPFAKKDGWLEHRKFAFNKSSAARCQRIVYPSAAAAANHRRAGLPEQIGTVISSGVDVDRFKPDDVARERVRAQLELPKDAVLVGMYAPFSPEYDYGTFLKAIGELVRTNPNLYCVIAGRGTVKGNAALTALIGGGAMSTRVRPVGEWTDLNALFNACDVVCSSATTDAARLTLAMSMLCGVMCVATSVGAQGEVLGNFGVSVELGSVDAMARGIRRILEMPADRRAFMAQSARKHVLQNFNIARAIEKFHEMYVELVTGEATAAAPASAVDAKDAAQAAAAEAIIASRAAATTLKAVAVIEHPAKEKAGSSISPETEAGFGSVQSSGTPIKPIAATNSPQATQAPTTATGTSGSMRALDAIDFDPLATGAIDVRAKAAAPVEEETNSATPWSEDDAKLMDDILVEADPETAKANAEKAAKAAKSAAAKAATNAALAAALGGDAEAGKSIDPKMLAAALNLSGGAKHSTAPRAVAGKPPPPPTLAATGTDRVKK